MTQQQIDETLAELSLLFASEYNTDVSDEFRQTYRKYLEEDTKE